MEKWSIGYFIGCILVTFLDAIPSNIWLITSFIVALILYPKQKILSGSLCAYCLFFTYANYSTSWSLTSLTAQTIELTGEITNYPKVFPYQVQLEVQLHTVNRQSLPILQSSKIILHDQELAHHYRIGDCVSFIAKLKPNHGLANPGSFNYEFWLFRQGIRATGKILRQYAPSNRQCSRITNQIRYSLQHALQQVLLTVEFSGIIQALILGEKQWITTAHRQMIQQQGIGHLLAISGMHIGAIYLISFTLFNLSRRFFLWVIPQSTILTIEWPIIVLSFIIALCYATLTGLSVSSQRAILMLLLGLITWRLGFNRPKILLVTATAILLWDPLQILEPGFWFSFIAITSVLFVMHFFAKTHWLKQLFYLQFLLLITLAPIAMWFTQPLLLSSWLVNIIAIPVVTFCILPLCLLGTFFIFSENYSYSYVLFQYVNQLLEYLFLGLSWLQHSPVLSYHPEQLIYVVSVSLLIIILINRQVTIRYFLIIPCIVLITKIINKQIQQPHWQVDILDVSQGLSILITQGEHHLLYDTGPNYSGQHSLISRVHQPLFYRRRIKQLDYLFISHSDHDHAGGMIDLLTQIPVKKLITNDQFKESLAHLFSKKSLQKQLIYPETIDNCTYKTWRWYQLTLTRWQSNTASTNNDNSCILKISDGYFSVLIPGDISQKKELELVKKHREWLKSTILISAHHGSKTASSYSFLYQVLPEYVIHSTGFLNHFGFPYPKVTQRFNTLNATQFNTATEGTVTIKIYNQQLFVSTYRVEKLKKWYLQYVP